MPKPEPPDKQEPLTRQMLEDALESSQPRPDLGILISPAAARSIQLQKCRRCERQCSTLCGASFPFCCIDCTQRGARGWPA